MDKKKIMASGLLQQYALGLTDPEEELQVEQALEVHPELEEQIRQIRQGISQYAVQSGIPAHPSRLGKAPQNEDSMPGKASQPGSNRPKVNFPVLIAFTGILALWYFQSSRSSSAMQTLRTELTQCYESRQQDQAQSQLYALINDPKAVPVTLQGTALSPEALSVAFWNTSSGKACILPSALPAPPSGFQYQVWADVNGEMIPIGLIDPASSSAQTLAFVNGAESINITIEPLGGSKHPTVEKLIANGSI